RPDVESLVTSLRLRQADGTYLRVGERDSRHRVILGAVMLPAEYVGDHDARVIHRHVRKGAVAHDVADRPYSGGRSHPVVNWDRPAGFVNADRRDSDISEFRAAAGGDKQLGSREIFAVRERDAELAAVVADLPRTNAGPHGDAVGAERARQQLAGLRLLERHQVPERL